MCVFILFIIKNKKEWSTAFIFLVINRIWGTIIVRWRVNIVRFGLLGVIVLFSGIEAKEQHFKVSTSVEASSKNELAEIDKEIDKLTNQRNLYLAKATRLQNQGDRLQFESNNLIDARRAWQQAQINREIATRIQEEIDQLEVRKKKITGSQVSPIKGKSKTAK